MSGFSDGVTCPNCGEEASRYSDYKPFDLVSLDCAYCGFYTSTTVEQLSLEELNDLRSDMDLKPLKKLPGWNLDEFGYPKIELKGVK